jgi:hypothetical protein
MSKSKPQTDPRGHSVRVYDDIYDSPAFRALSPHDVLAYLALLRELKGYNNGDLSLPLTRSRKCGISHPKTLARSLRALCAVGLVAVSRRGGCNKGGERLPNLYRVTDRDCYSNPAKFLEAMPASNEWKWVTSIEHAHRLIQEAEAVAITAYHEKKAAGHAVTVTRSPGALVKPKTKAPCDPRKDEPGYRVNKVPNAGNSMPVRVPEDFSSDFDEAGHRARRSTPLYLYQPRGQTVCIHEHGSYHRMMRKPARIFSRLSTDSQTSKH